jgi:hypothetical protein
MMTATTLCQFPLVPISPHSFHAIPPLPNVGHRHLPNQILANRKIRGHVPSLFRLFVDLVLDTQYTTETPIRKPCPQRRHKQWHPDFDSDRITGDGFLWSSLLNTNITRNLLPTIDERLMPAMFTEHGGHYSFINRRDANAK